MFRKKPTTIVLATPDTKKVETDVLDLKLNVNGREVSGQSSLDKINYIKTESDAHFIRALDIMYQRLDVKDECLANVFPKDKQLHQKMLTGFKALIEAFMTINRKELANEDAALIYSVLYDDGMNTNVNYYSSHAAAGDIEKAANSDIPSSRNSEIKFESFEGSLKHFIQLFLAIQDRTEKAIVDKRISERGYKTETQRLPVVELANSELNDAFNRIEKLWTDLVERQNSDDDAHFLETMRVSYLPNALAMHSQFKDTEEDLLHEADKLLSGQFATLENHLLKIRKSHLERTLVEMRMQAQFLESRTEEENTKPRFLTATPIMDKQEREMLSLGSL